MRTQLDELKDLIAQTPRDDACIIVSFGIMASGYSHLNFNGKVTTAHRIAWMLTFGDPLGMDVCHKCDVRNCVRLSHLFLGDREDNMQDCLEKGRFARGSRHGQSKLTEENVREIRSLIKAGMSQTWIAYKFSIRREAVSKIVCGRNWGWAK